jgi:hypothetical protein
MISGMINPKNWLKMDLNVANARAAHTGITPASSMPRTMAIRILTSRFSFILNIFLMDFLWKT